LEREREHAPTRGDHERTAPSREIVVASRSKGSTLRLGRLDDAHGSRLRAAVHFVAQGHAWRTTGVAIELGEVPALIAALEALVAEPAVVAEPRRPVRAPRAPVRRKRTHPPGVKKIFSTPGGKSDILAEDATPDCDAWSEDSDDEL